MRTQGMRGIFLIAITAMIALGIGHGEARAGTWCAIMPGSDTTMTCGIPSYAACHEEVHGTGGTSVCTPDPYSRAVEVSPRARPSRHLRQSPQ
jgi:hypothetical protein